MESSAFFKSASPFSVVGTDAINCRTSSPPSFVEMLFAFRDETLTTFDLIAPLDFKIAEVILCAFSSTRGVSAVPFFAWIPTTTVNLLPKSSSTLLPTATSSCDCGRSFAGSNTMERLLSWKTSPSVISAVNTMIPARCFMTHSMYLLITSSKNN